MPRVAVPFQVNITGLHGRSIYGLPCRSEIKRSEEIYMARPVKQGIDYFPLDVRSDEKLELLEAEFGLQAFAIVVKLFQKIYGERGYYCEWSEEVALLFAKKNNAGCSVVSEIVKAAVKRGIFDGDLYRKYNILTSKGIQERYMSAVSKRVQVEIKDEFWLISYAENCKSSVNNSVSDGRNGVNSVDNAQIKENKTKQNKIKENKSVYGAHAHVLLTDNEYSSLLKDYNNADELIQFLDDYIEEKDYKVKSHYLSIKRWVWKAVTERKPKPQIKKGILNNFDQPMPDFNAIEQTIWKKQNTGGKNHD